MSGVNRATIFLALAVLCTAGPLRAHPADSLVGGAQAGPGEILMAGVLDGRRDKVDLGDVEVRVNGTLVQKGANGHFAANVAIAPYYRIDIAGNGIFPMVQTFGNAELRDPSCQCLNIPAIELVARKKGRIELFFGGDSMAGRRFFEERRNGPALLDHVTLDRDLDQLFAAIKPYFEYSDLASVNLESVVAEQQPGPAAPKKYVFYSPPELAHAMVRAGIDHVSLGNNHTADYRAAGLTSTTAALDAAHLAWSGAGINEEQAEQASRFDLNGQKLGLFGFVGWRGNWEPNQVAMADKAGAAWGQRKAIDRVMQRERKSGHIPIMQLHGSAEYGDRSSPASQQRFRMTIDMGAPIAIGHHPHVTHGLEIYRGGLIAHSLGNFLFDQDRPQTQITYGLKVWLEKGKFLRAEAVPIQMLDYRPVPAVGGMREALLRRLNWLSSELGTVLARSGGHAAVWAKGGGVISPGCRAPQAFVLASLAPVCADAAQQFGRNLVPRGDFENARMLDAQDRFWSTRNAALDYRTDNRGEGYLALLPESGTKSAYLYSASYIRDVSATRFSLRSRIRLPRAGMVELLIKERPQDGDAPTPSTRGEVLGSARIMGGDWQNLGFDFLRSVDADGAARAFRPILRVTFDDRSETGDRTILLDDFELIEWAESMPADDPAQAWRWTHARPLAPTPHFSIR
ncbi:CapA family protein [Erythrobacteraceae bacterium E2-1 Yellow Sea]|nr:CapA family protein [Erythrobacteraceae bacterium E2-1 Yellow Sea]